MLPAVVDSHLHLWDPARQDYPWLAEVPALHRRFGPEDLDIGTVELAAVVFVEAGCDPDQAGRELDWIEEVAAEWPALRAVVAQAPLERGASARPTVEDLAARPLVTGVRRNLQAEAAGFISAPELTTGVRLLAEHSLSFDACVRWQQLEELILLADRCPDVTIVLDHLGKPDIRHRERRQWERLLTELAARPNVYAKLSGLTTEADWETWQPADILPYLRHALEVFTPERCMFGSDWPVAGLATGYQRWVEVVLDALHELQPAERAAVLTGVATKVYRPYGNPSTTRAA